MLYNIMQMAGGQNRLVGTKKGTNSPLLVLRFSPRYSALLKRVAKARKAKPSTLARDLLEKALEREERRR